MMEKQIALQGKQVTIQLSTAAEKALSSRDKTLVVEIEVYFISSFPY